MQVCSQTALASSKKPPCYNEYKVRQPNHYNKEESKWTIIVYHTQNGHANIIQFLHLSLEERLYTCLLYTSYSVVYTNDKGEYSFQASKGTYCFKAGESFTVDDGPLKKAITLPVCEMYSESSLCLYLDGFASGDITADLKADGSFSFYYVPYGTDSWV